jgi:hypothetical protein
VSVTAAPNFSGPLTANTLNIGSGTAIGYGASSHCGFTDNSFTIYNGSSFNLSGDTSGDIGVCGALNTVGAETVGGALTANAGFIVAAGGEAITGSSSVTGSDTIGTGLIVSAGGASITGVSLFAGPLLTESVAAGTATYVPPIYTSGGAAVASTEHGVQYSCTFAAATTCAVTLTGTSTGRFASTAYACPAPDMGAATTYVGYTVGSKATTGFTIYASASNSNTVSGVCWGA